MLCSVMYHDLIRENVNEIVGRNYAALSNIMVIVVVSGPFDISRLFNTRF